MAATTAKKPCAKCNKGGGVTTCDGCRQSYCTKHFVEHRLELSQQMDAISQDHDLLRQEMTQDTATHALLTRVDSWEQEMLGRVQAAAENARVDLRQILERTKNELKPPVEKMTEELSASQKSDDFTESDLRRWAEQLKELRKKLDAPSMLSFASDDELKASLTLIRINDKQQRSSTPTIRNLDRRNHTLRDSAFIFADKQQRPSTPVTRATDHRLTNARECLACLPDKQHRSSTPTLRAPTETRAGHLKDSVASSTEKFDEIDGKAQLAENNLVATCCLASILTQPIIYGADRYSTGRHAVRFRVEKMGDLRLFFGIIRSLENVSRSGQAQNNNNTSLYGWWDLNETVVSGKTQASKYRSIVATGDELTLIVDCENKQIHLQHHRTKRLAQCLVDVDKCPFPWKVVIRLQSAGDCVRILQ